MRYGPWIYSSVPPWIGAITQLGPPLVTSVVQSTGISNQRSGQAVAAAGAKRAIDILGPVTSNGISCGYLNDRRADYDRG